MMDIHRQKGSRWHEILKGNLWIGNRKGNKERQNCILYVPRAMIRLFEEF